MRRAVAGRVSRPQSVRRLRTVGNVAELTHSVVTGELSADPSVEPPYEVQMDPGVSTRVFRTDGVYVMGGWYLQDPHVQCAYTRQSFVLHSSAIDLYSVGFRLVRSLKSD